MKEKTPYKTLIEILKTRDYLTTKHCNNVALLSICLGENLALTGQELFFLYISSLYHDIGKIAIPDRILFKKGKLEDKEFEVVKKHAELGSNLVSATELSLISPYIRSHHESWNGNGYPDGKIKKEIPLPSRIIRICDVFEAFVSERPYREALPVRKALAEMEKIADTFDPELLDIFFSSLTLSSEKTSQDLLQKVRSLIRTK